MKAVILNEAGGVGNLQFAEIDKPVIGNDEVLVKVVSVSINPVDVKSRAYEGVLHWIFEENRPVILGWDISGEVVETGKDVTDFKTGDEVFGMVNFFGKGNAYAEYVAAPAAHLALKPRNITHQQAAAASMAASTAYQALVDVAGIKKGSKVLVHAASGGVGHFAVQMAKYFGAYVIGVSSGKNKEFVLSLGADEHIDYTTENFHEKVQDVDIVIDTLQGKTLSDSVDVVKENGIIITLPTPEIPEDIAEKAGQKKVNIQFMMVQSKKETAEAIAGLLEQGALKPSIYKIFPFEDIALAHLEVETNRVAGKVIVNL
ncbi:NADPH:quinone reductase-like Zn-dependent oxidoreductase [Chryseobacterium bernardetii]|uniref:NADPH:quinone reductase-like Zn-dependent oxidoreductase n=2 Tax=Chryseobacterium TaxID=59732 RepID=A0A543EBM8_9FLAO|nr:MULTISPECIES: NADP-dependent oxidoreductase [Chryseobacterium]MDR6371402.1 NADPH:quinone reductase-like Zn-dependent oxidoreductase [Chryseobacterium vietnamense]MDR6442093.1 NADPH:quinone reductase-like Zn-dependent oxidoreductase [Chryseobacterium bernardetii]TQM18971.1 NADPH:quinone reductase-like Zn-dependent oxidoreductase [Chryseobacterium aquifrigidense]